MLKTEMRNPATTHIDEMSTAEMVQVMNQENLNAAMAVSQVSEAIAEAIGTRLDRGATFLHGEGSYSHKETKVVLAAI